MSFGASKIEIFLHISTLQMIGNFFGYFLNMGLSIKGIINIDSLVFIPRYLFLGVSSFEQLLMGYDVCLGLVGLFDVLKYHVFALWK